MGSRVVVAALATVVTVACSRSYLQRGSDLYASERYIEAAEVFERSEARLANYSEREQARYGLYRGLTLLALGDRNGAHQWFAYCAHVTERYPDALSTGQRAELDRGWQELGRQLRQAPTLEPDDDAVAGTGDAALPEKRSLH